MKNIIYILLFPVVLFSQVNFSEDISSIIYNNCTECHRDGQSGPMSFTNYEEVASLGFMVKLVTQIGYMPPWHADPEYTNFIGERFLTDQEKQLIADWVDGGMTQGDPSLESEIPNFPEGSAVGDPDFVLTMEEEYLIEGNNQDDYRVFVFETNFSEDKDLRSIEFIPGNLEAVHHVLINIDTEGECAALDALTPEYGYECESGFCTGGIPFLATGYVPGMVPPVWNNDVGLILPQGADIAIQVHYAPNSIDQYDQSSINLFFKDQSIEREIDVYPLLDTELFIPANEVYTHYNSMNIEDEIGFDISLLSILPHMHLIGKSWLVYAENNGDTIPIINIPDWDFNWQNFYQPEYMLKVPKEYTIHAYATYDNTSDNFSNPNSPPQNMFWCDYTTCEMFFLPFSYVEYQEGDENIYLGNSEDLGCTDSNACNYSLEAIIDNGTCGILDDCGECFIPCCFNANTNTCDYTIGEQDCEYYWAGFDIVSDPEENIFWNTSCESGCTDPQACNYDDSIMPGGFDDGSCEYAADYYDCDGNCLNDVNANGMCDEDEQEDCSSLEIASIYQYNDTQFVINVYNSSWAGFPYPGFVLFNSFGDTVAVENVNLFGIGEESQHFLELQDGVIITSDISLQLYTGFYDFLQCEWSGLVITENCDLLPDPGPCFAAIEIFYYNQDTGICEETTWGGCGGIVPFWTLEDCQHACESIDIEESSKDVRLVVRSDLLGRKTYGQLGYVISIYEDGSVEKEFILEK